MAGNYHKTFITGHLGSDPDLRYMPSGDPVCNFSVAVTESWKDKTSGEKKEHTTWYKCVVRRQLAEVCGQYLKKGSSVLCVGRIRERKWTDKEGIDRFVWELHVDEMQMLDKKDSSDRPASTPPRQASAPASNAGGGFNDFEDDIPFNSIGRGASAYVI